ncbi:MAG: hypothetical protein JEY79_15560 [Pseudodesulfovibrio sp.]|nr:hypothetical protein [Pseudodesulfovibrio sp.]
MRWVARTALRKAVTNMMAVVISFAFLSGCAVVGPLLSMGGLVGFAPLQYASTVYTVSEFSYEYAANDNDPGELIEAKIDAFLTGKAFELPEYMQADKPDTVAPVMVAAVGIHETPALSLDARQKRIDKVLGRRNFQFERLELRRMAFFKARDNGTLSLRQTAMAESPDLFHGAVDEVSLD